jgi:hypothetical protein
VIAKGKNLLLHLDAEVRPDASKVQRLTSNGKLILTMPLVVGVVDSATAAAATTTTTSSDNTDSKRTTSSSSTGNDGSSKSKAAVDVKAFMAAAIPSLPSTLKLSTRSTQGERGPARNERTLVSAGHHPSNTAAANNTANTNNDTSTVASKKKDVLPLVAITKQSPVAPTAVAAPSTPAPAATPTMQRSELAKAAKSKAMPVDDDDDVPPLE